MGETGIRRHPVRGHGELLRCRRSLARTARTSIPDAAIMVAGMPCGTLNARIWPVIYLPEIPSNLVPSSTSKTGGLAQMLQINGRKAPRSCALSPRRRDSPPAAQPVRASFDWKSPRGPKRGPLKNLWVARGHVGQRLLSRARRMRETAYTTPAREVRFASRTAMSWNSDSTNDCGFRLESAD